MVGTAPILAEISPEQTWAVVMVGITCAVAATTALVKGLAADKRKAEAEVVRLKNASAEERHKAVIDGIGDVKAETRGLKHEVHQLRKDHDELRPRVERIEHTLRHDGGAN